MEKILLTVDPLDDLPGYQSPDSILELVNSIKTGDIVHLIPQGQKLDYCMQHGLPQIHGCVEENKDGRIVLWSTYFAFDQDAFRSDESRTFAPTDISLLKIERAEEYIPKASRGKFSYKCEAQVMLPDGHTYNVIVDSYFDGIVSGIAQGDRISGGANYFEPIAKS